MRRFKPGDIVKLSKALFNGTIMYPTGIQMENRANRKSSHYHKFLHNFKENEVGIVTSGPYNTFDAEMWEIFINNDFWLVDNVHMSTINENESK